MLDVSKEVERSLGFLISFGEDKLALKLVHIKLWCPYQR